ncbi:hypothetical protein IU436_29785 [Nocardia farcinica]|uniref:hypothetical protein n=1 Tax=Nocardia farcinica TaxID=37329 RepID=UPI001895BD38|nr:hypothetical protein [Nocardia farcinica]MBF6422890.1 hypothetical protein [Nocardia farcinica]MBF6434512.1 hypothetical protein [Nocardia farcinica]MBF6505597.1 hypothetical protein [Nocardia farcinica]
MDNDITNAEVYIETADEPIAGGTWYIQPDDTVIYERPNGERVAATIAADTLRSRPAWKRRS